MFAYVKLFSYHQKTFVYKIPKHLISQVDKGSIVQISFKNKTTVALVTQITDHVQCNFAIKEILDIHRLPDDQQFKPFINKVAQLYQVDSTILIGRIKKFLSEKESAAIPPCSAIQEPSKNITFNQEQQDAINTISTLKKTMQYQPILLHGVTGSGKTEIYKELISETLKNNQSIIFMLPEVTLALKFEALFVARFGKEVVFSFHCGSNKKQKNTLWQALLEKKSIIIIGVHLPILLPIANLGAIIVDEEHDSGFQEKSHPKIHSRDMAILRASMYNAPIVLGSATPSIQSLWNAQHKKWTQINITKRYAGAFPTVQIALLKNEKRSSHFLLSDTLIHAIQDRLNKKEQTIIFLNRRGFSFFVQCPCGFVFNCHQCSVSLTLHDGSLLICHYCATKQALAHFCPMCKSNQIHFLKKGIGTQQLVSLLAKIFPSATIARADMDSTSKKKSWAQTVTDMHNGNIDILVGTQSISKGYHFEKVTLVGIIWADLNLHFPMYNAAEVCLQQLIQVAGRAGRQSESSLVLVQAFDNHPIFSFLQEEEYLKFYTYEIEKRITVGYPPYKHIASIEVRNKNKQELICDANTLATTARKLSERNFVEIFGPIPSITAQVKGMHSMTIFMKSFSRLDILKIAQQLPQTTSSTSFCIDFV